MYKVFLIAAVIAMAAARPQHGHGHDNHNGHGHAYSSQSIVLHHKTKHEPHHYHQQEGQQEHHGQGYGHYEHHGHEEQQGHAHGHEEHNAQAHGHNEQHGHHVDYYAHPKYEYAYEIKDPHTHDFKSQHEHRDGDSVKGEYSLHQPDGTVRIVKYYADKKTGFHADVKFEGHAQHFVPEHHHNH